MKVIMISEEQFERAIERFLANIRKSADVNPEINDVAKSLSFRTVNYYVHTMKDEITKENL